jgi:transcriptional regulator with XRE-family HTH domain
VPRYLRTSNAQILDRKRTELQAAAAALRQRPVKGWVHALRSALGMSVTVLARRLGVSHSTVLSYEKAELTGRIQIDTLRRVADALDAELAYSDDGDRHFRFHVTGQEGVEVLGRDDNSVGHDRGLVGTSFLEFGTTERLTFQI